MAGVNNICAALLELAAFIVVVKVVGFGWALSLAFAGFARRRSDPALQAALIIITRNPRNKP
ncbi:MAG TPA: hypothetical protein VKG24_08805 [Pseudolabrys sp.]|jgi:hypothetical protein|nr:hypothetical protein [Pseudolabrys sp.]